MARSVLPNALERRVLIEREIEASQALRIAEAYLADERCAEAVSFLRKAGARERLLELRAQAIEAGDLFLLREVAAALGETPSVADWRTLAHSAEREGKQRYADAARHQLGRGEV